MIPIEIGSVSHGTLRTPDLLRAFAGTLERLIPHTYAGLIQDARDSAEEIDSDPGHPGNNECGLEIVQELIDALDQLAPDGVYFGAHEGDGADFGFWRIA